MTLADLRRAAVRHQQAVWFRLSNGMDCVVNEHGIVQIPELRRKVEFSVETELATATEFRRGDTPVNRADMEKWATPAVEAAAGDHDD
jgi:hypothetical protein